MACRICRSMGASRGVEPWWRRSAAAGVGRRSQDAADRSAERRAHADGVAMHEISLRLNGTIGLRRLLRKRRRTFYRDFGQHRLAELPAGLKIKCPIKPPYRTSGGGYVSGVASRLITSRRELGDGLGDFLLAGGVALALAPGEAEPQPGRSWEGPSLAIASRNCCGVMGWRCSGIGRRSKTAPWSEARRSRGT